MLLTHIYNSFTFSLTTVKTQNSRAGNLASLLKWSLLQKTERERKKRKKEKKTKEKKHV